MTKLYKASELLVRESAVEKAMVDYNWNHPQDGDEDSEIHDIAEFAEFADVMGWTFDECGNFECETFYE